MTNHKYFDIDKYLRSEEGQAALTALEKRRSIFLKFRRNNKDAIKLFNDLGISLMSHSRLHIYYKGIYKGNTIVISFYPQARTYSVHTHHIIERDLHNAIHNQVIALDDLLKQEIAFGGKSTNG